MKNAYLTKKALCVLKLFEFLYFPVMLFFLLLAIPESIEIHWR